MGVGAFGFLATCLNFLTATGYNESANFRFLQRLSYLASAETVRDLLLPAETVVHGK